MKRDYDPADTIIRLDALVTKLKTLAMKIPAADLVRLQEATASMRDAFAAAVEESVGARERRS